jgi:large subunit ribosomal protein L17
MRNLARAVFEHERIVTTVEKAKEARRFVERLITIAKNDTLHARRLVLARLGPIAKSRIYDKENEPTDDRIVDKLFGEIGPRFRDRPGGYTRVIKRHERRLGDGGRTAFLELLKDGETKHRARAPEPVAPRLKESEPTD